MPLQVLPACRCRCCQRAAAGARIAPAPARELPSNARGRIKAGSSKAANREFFALTKSCCRMRRNGGRLQQPPGFEGKAAQSKSGPAEGAGSQSQRLNLGSGLPPQVAAPCFFADILSSTQPITSTMMAPATFMIISVA